MIEEFLNDNSARVSSQRFHLFLGMSLPALSQFSSVNIRISTNFMYVVQERRVTDFEAQKL